MAEHFTTKRLLAWINHRKCLCGCGKRVKLLRNRAEAGQSYFTNKCWPKIARQYDLRPRPTAPVRRDPVWLAKVRAENIDRLCTHEDTRWYCTLVQADMHDRGISAREWCREKGFGEDWLYAIFRAGREPGQRITKYNAARILMALGEKVPEDLAYRYRSHVKQEKKRAREARVDSARRAG